MLPGYNEEWPTSEYEHQEILRLFKQDPRWVIEASLI